MIADVLTGIEVRRFQFARDRVIGDAHVRADTNYVAALTLYDGAGRTGLGFFDALFAPLPPRRWLHDYIERRAWPSLAGRTPEAVLHRIDDARGGNRVVHPFNIADAIDQALWDLAAKRAAQPLWRMLGAEAPAARAYASGLCFNMTDVEVERYYRAARDDRHTSYKIKLGHPDLGWDRARLALVAATVGPGSTLMIDANEAWTVAETRRRVAAFAADGIVLHWVEDPIMRDDVAGLVALRGSLGDVLLNAGEYLGTPGRLALIAEHAVDVVPLHDHFTDNRRIAQAAAEQGLRVTVGNTSMNMGAHLAAALPHLDHIEDSRLNSSVILAQPLPVVAGMFRLPDTPGHGLALSPDADQFAHEG